MPVTLTLGDITFRDAEIPEHIAVKTRHQNIVHRLVGGARQIDMLGPDHEPLVWSGWLTGTSALDRALTLKGMCDAGLMVVLTWSEFMYQVVISDFEADFEREYQIPYRITCIVSLDMTAANAEAIADSVDDIIMADSITATSLSSGFPSLAGAMTSLNGAISAVSSFATAAKSEINSVLGPLNAARGQVQTLIASTENTLQSVTTLGGILPNNPLSKQVASISTQINAMQNQTALVQLHSVLGRMGVNLGQVGSGSKTVMVGGGSLFDLASKFYGKVSGWTLLQNANPQLKGETTINGNQSITIPPYTGNSGGILSV